MIDSGVRPLFSPKYRAMRAEALARELDAPKEPPPETKVEYVVGLDLGQAQDYSALTVVERTAPPDAEPIYAVRHLHRWPLGTSYATIADDVAALVYRPELLGCRLAADRTGVGRAVVEMIDQALADAKGENRAADLVGILITAGHQTVREGHDWHVAKKELVSALQALLSSGRLKIAPELALAETLVKELKAFKVKITVAGNETFEAWRERDHDDLVLAVALAVWLADRGPRGRFEIYV
jgi:Terminase RNaseH-like domain